MDNTPQDWSDLEASLFNEIDGHDHSVRTGFKFILEHSPQSALELLTDLMRQANDAVKH